MEKAARLQVLSPVKRVVFALKRQEDKKDNNLITIVRSERNGLTESAYIW